MSGDDRDGGASEEGLALSDHLRLALDAGGVGTWRWDIATGITEWDRETERMFGLEPGTFDGTFDAWAAALHPDDRAEVIQTVEAAVAAKGDYRIEHRTITPSGEVRWIEGAGRVTVDAEGQVTGTIGCTQDITERARNEHERQRLSEVAVESLERERLQRERLELVAVVNEALEDTGDLPALMRRVTQAVVPRLGDWCSLHVFESEQAPMPIVVTSHRDPEMVRYAEELQARHPFDPDDPVGVAAVMRTGRAEFHPVIDEDLIAGADVTEEQRAIVRDLALRSAISVPLTKRGRALGAMQFVMSEGHRSYTEEDLTLAEAIAARIAASLDNRRLRDQRDRTACTDAALAGLGRRLAASASVAQVLAVIAEDAPRVLRARRADIALARDAESLTLVGERERVIPRAAAGPVAQAFDHAETILHERDEWRPPADDDLIGDGALVASPLYDDVHQAMGVLILTWTEPRSFDEVDVNAVETLSRLCGQAIVRSQLAGHTEAMAELAASMAAARRTTDVARLLRDHGTSNLGATIANLRVVDLDSETLVPILPSPLPAEIAQRYERLSMHAVIPLTDSVRHDEAIWLPDLEGYGQRYPDAALEAASAGIGSSAAIPLHDSDGAVVAAVAFAWPAAMRLDERMRSRLATVCDLAAQTLERVRLFEAEHAVIASMQRRLLTPLPEVEGLEMAAFYEPAAAAVGMGGDWYEAIPLADGTLVVIVGDVVGHGVNAVAAMAQIQHLLTGLIRAGTPLPELFAVADAMIAGSDHTYATAVLLHIDAEGGRVGYLSAGHPWVLLRHPDGTVRPLDGNQQLMFGLELQPSALVYEPLPAGSLLLAYTDGLVERRGEPIDAAIDRLARSFGQLEVDELERSLHQLVADVRDLDPALRATSDDIVAMLIRVGVSP